MERVRKFSIKYVVVALLLALALPFSSFASENVSLDDSQFSLIWNANNWNYFSQTSNGSISSHVGYYQPLYMFNGTSNSSTYNGFISFGRGFSFSSLNTSRITVSIPLYLHNVDFASFDLFYGLTYFDNVSGTVNSKPINYNNSVSLRLARFQSIDATDPDDGLGSGGHLFDITHGESYYFRPSEEASDSFLTYPIYLNRANLFRDLSVLDVSSIGLITIFFDISNLPSSYPLTFFVGFGSNSEIGSQDGQQQAIIGGLSGIQGTIDSMVNDMQQNDGKILDELGNVLYELEGDAVTASDAEQLVQESVSKGEELEQLGDALANVEKPNVNSLTSVMNPTTILQNNDSASVQLALSSIYSWDKLLAILGVLVAVFSISYILFGKKS